MVVKKNTKYYITKVIITGILILLALFCLVPFLMVISISFSSEESLIQGYSLIPREFSLEGYRYLFNSPKQIINSYLTTIFVTLVGTIGAMTIMTGVAYPLSRRDFKYKKYLSFFVYFTMLFSGGMIPSYILITRYLHLKDTIWVLILPLMFNAWNVFLLRTFFQKLPISLIESAKLDGASEFKTFIKIALPLNKTGIATVALFELLIFWNDWFNSMLYIDRSNIVSLQYMLNNILDNVNFLMKSSAGGMSVNTATVPTETVRMATVVIAAGPMVFVFPFFQKYFAKGIMVGAIKE